MVVIGGDGSLTGADMLRAEWAGLITELVHMGELPAEIGNAHPHLSIVGMVGLAGLWVVG